MSFIMALDVLSIRSEFFLKALDRLPALGPQLSRRRASMARTYRLMRLTTAMSKGVVVPFSN
jgi:hypothetical protein